MRLGARHQIDPNRLAHKRQKPRSSGFQAPLEGCRDLERVLFRAPLGHAHVGRASQQILAAVARWNAAETSQAICSVLMGGVLHEHPRLKLCFAHGGGSYPAIHARVAHGFRVRPDLCATDCKVDPSEFHGKFWTDSLVHDPECLRLLASVVGKNRICLGTDYPFPLGELEVGKVVETYEDFTAEEKDAVMWKNAIEMLDVDESILKSTNF